MLVADESVEPIPNPWEQVFIVRNTDFAAVCAPHSKAGLYSKVLNEGLKAGLKAINEPARKDFLTSLKAACLPELEPDRVFNEQLQNLAHFVHELRQGEVIGPYQMRYDDPWPNKELFIKQEYQASFQKPMEPIQKTKGPSKKNV